MEKFILFVILAWVCGQLVLARPLIGPDYVDSALQKYPSANELKSWLEDYTLSERCGAISKLHTIGKSVNGVPIWALEISNNPGRIEAKPNIKVVGNIHGNEPLGRVLLPAYAEWICKAYQSKSSILAKKTVDRLHLWLVPALNPDGFASGRRENANNIDLNRDFPDQFLDKSLSPKGKEQPETKAIIDWISPNHTLSKSVREDLPARHFTGSLGLHEGALVVNYPWDGRDDGAWAPSIYNASPDDNTFKWLSRFYASRNKKISSVENSEFASTKGITNGAGWYPIYGGMQDYNYIVGGCLELTLELSIDKWPAPELLPTYWEDNRLALSQWPLAAAFSGVYGSVYTIEKGGKKQRLTGATIAVVGIPKGGATFSSGFDYGDFYRPLAPGKYSIEVSKKGYRTSFLNIRVPTTNEGVRLEITLRSENDASGSSTNFERLMTWRESAIPFSGPAVPLSALLIGVCAFVVAFWLVRGKLKKLAVSRSGRRRLPV